MKSPLMANADVEIMYVQKWDIHSIFETISAVFSFSFHRLLGNYRTNLQLTVYSDPVPPLLKCQRHERRRCRSSKIRCPPILLFALIVITTPHPLINCSIIYFQGGL